MHATLPKTHSASQAVTAGGDLSSISRVAPPISRRDLLIAFLFVAASILILQRPWRDILHLGLRDEELSYVLLAPLIILWLVWQRRELISRCRSRGGWAGLLILLMGWSIYTYGYFADKLLWRGAAVMIAVGAFISVAGIDVLLRFAPVFAACVFLIPIGTSGRYHFAMPLETATAHATQTVCDILGMYVDRAGNKLSINGTDVTIAEACNGMRMVLTLFMVCYVVAFSTPLRWQVRGALLAASPLVAIVANVVRLVPTIWMYGNSSMSRAERFHDASGWVMTVAAFIVLMGFLRFLTRVPKTKAGPGGIQRCEQSERKGP